MQVTCFHEESKGGIPVIVDDQGEVVDYPSGLTKVLDELGWSRAEFAQKMGYKNARAVEQFWQKRIPPANVLNMLELALEAPPEVKGRDALAEVKRAHANAERLARGARIVIRRALRAKFRAAAIVEQVKSHVYAHNKYLGSVLTPRQIKTYVSLLEYYHQERDPLWSKDVLHRAGILHKKPKRRGPLLSKWKYKHPEPSEEQLAHWESWARDQANQ